MKLYLVLSSLVVVFVISCRPDEKSKEEPATDVQILQDAYIVQAGDTFSDICRRLRPTQNTRTCVGEILCENGQEILVGQRLRFTGVTAVVTHAPTPPGTQATPTLRPATTGRQFAVTVTTIRLTDVTPTPTPDFTCGRSQSDVYCIHPVQDGESLAAIGVRFGLRGTANVSPSQLIDYSNPQGIRKKGSSLCGHQSLRIPRQNAVIHMVREAETLADIAVTYGVTEMVIISVPANSLRNGEPLENGRELLIPNPRWLPTIFR